MSDIVMKAEDEDDDNSNSSIFALTTLLQEVKKEEQKSLSDEETQPEHIKAETLPESFFDDLYREELEAACDEATTDADLQKLQEIIQKKKRILDEDFERDRNERRRKSRSRNSPSRSRKRKNCNTNNENQQKGIQAKRPRKTVDTQEAVHRNESPTLDTSLDHDRGNQQPSSQENDCLTSTEQATDPELELENLLKTEDYNSDEEPPSSSQAMMLNSTMQPIYAFPNTMTMPMVPTMYSPAANQMVANMPPGGYPMMCNMGFPPGFYPPNMMHSQMMGYGLPQMHVPSTETEVQCLPVTSNSGLPKIPFKKIKLEKVDKTAVPPAEDTKKKIIDACKQLLMRKMDSAQPTGRFIYTSTVTKHNNALASNSVLQKITNVSYNFQSIGPKPNLKDWGLKGIPNANVEIAKKISMSADKYFNKIAQNANTIARKLVTEEVAKADKDQDKIEMEYEELTLSSYFKNSMTQTDPLVCRECVARKRKVGHDIGVQASVFKGSIAIQTSPEVRFNDQLTEGLSDIQLKAMYEFSLLIRGPPKNSSVEFLRLREQLINMGPVPFIDASISRIQNISRNQTIQQPPVHIARQNILNYSQNAMRIPNQQNHSAQLPGRMINEYQYQQSRPQERAMQIPSQQRHLRHPGQVEQYPYHSLPDFPSQ